MLLYFGVVLAPLAGSLTVSNVAALPSSFLRDSAGAFAALLGVPPANLYAVNLTDVATGASLQVGSVRRQLGGIGSLGVRVTFVARLGKTPTEAFVTNVSNVLASPALTASTLRTVATSLGSAAGLGASAYAVTVPASGIALANSPFILGGGAVVVASTGDGGGGGGSATGGIVGGIVGALALACCVWAFRSWSKHGVLPCCRDRKKELVYKRQAQAEQDDVARAIEEAEAAVAPPAPAEAPAKVVAVARPTKPKLSAAAAAQSVRKLAVAKAEAERAASAATAELAALKKQLAAAKAAEDPDEAAVSALRAALRAARENGSTGGSPQALQPQRTDFAPQAASGAAGNNPVFGR